MTKTILRSPVLVLTCNRVGHFKALVESLRRCLQASETELYIAIDGPFDPSVRQANDEIIRYSESLDGFAHVQLYERGQNIGPYVNFRLAVADIFSSHDTIIVLEDDNVVAANFLAFMNAALSQFNENPKCFAVCGYNLPTPKPDECCTDIYCSALVCAWGIGLFRDRYSEVGLGVKSAPDRFFLNPWNVVRMNRLSPPLFPLLVHGFMTQQEFGDVLFSAHSLRNGMFSVYPVDTKVMNMGLDGSGIHCGKSDAYAHQGFIDAEKGEFNLEPSEPTNDYFVRSAARFYKTEFGHSWPKSLRAYVVYVLCLFLGREGTVSFKKFVKSQLRRLGRERGRN
jgi:hypothetical protein